MLNLLFSSFFPSSPSPSSTGHSMVERITYIASQEHVNLAPGAMDTILQASGGDMRKAVTFLQTSHQLSSRQIGEEGVAGVGQVTSDIVIDIAGQVPPTVMDELWTAMSGTKFDSMKAAVDNILYQGYPMVALLSQIYDDTVAKPNISDINKALICEKLACAELALVDGSSEGLQLLDVAAFIMRRMTDGKSGVDALLAEH